MQCDLLGGHFETAQVWRQEHNPAAGVEDALHHVPVLDRGMAGDPFRPAAPDEGQLDDGFARLGNGGAALCAEARLCQVRIQAAPIGR